MILSVPHVTGGRRRPTPGAPTSRAGVGAAGPAIRPSACASLLRLARGRRQQRYKVRGTSDGGRVCLRACIWGSVCMRRGMAPKASLGRAAAACWWRGLRPGGYVYDVWRKVSFHVCLGMNPSSIEAWMGPDCFFSCAAGDVAARWLRRRPLLQVLVRGTRSHSGCL
jgi:hypothetical protein